MNKLELIANRTWSFRNISQFSTPLFSSVHNKGVDLLRKLDEELTNHVRNYCSGNTCNKNNIKGSSRKRKHSNKSSSAIDGTGTFVLITWITLPSNEDEGGKEKQLLHFDVRIRDEQTAQVVLCFPKYVSGNTSIHHDDGSITSFAFAMVRGLESSFRAVLHYLQLQYGCAISNKPFLFSPMEVSHALVTWSLYEKNLYSSSNNGSISSTTTALRPLEITFALPSNLAVDGLHNIILTIPPVSLNQLCDTIQSQCGTSVDNELQKNIKSNLPVLKVLQAFILEAFHMDIRTFTVNKCSNGMAVIGCDGRFKPLNSRTLPFMLRTLHHMFQIRVLRSNTS